MPFTSHVFLSSKSSVPSTVTGLLVIIWLFWGMKRLLKGAVEWPSNVAIRRYPTIFGRWLSGFHWLLNAPDILSNSYVPGVPFAVPTPENHFVVVSSPAHIKELGDAPEITLSLHAWAKDMFQLEHTLQGIKVHDQTSVNGSIHHRVLRTVLPAKFPLLQDGLQKKIAGAFSKQFVSGKRNVDGWTSLQTVTMSENVVGATNSYVFFGEHLSSDLEYLQAAIQYPHDIVNLGEALRFTPSFMAPIVISTVTQRERARKHLISRLTQVVQERLGSRTTGSPPQAKALDVIQWVIDSSSRKDTWTAGEIVQVVIGLWFGSVHQLNMSLVYTLYDLCAHPEYLNPLRQEIEEQMKTNNFEKLPRLDSFLRESARLNPSDSIAMRRKAIGPYTFSDGVHVPEGNYLCIPLGAILRDPANYSDTNVFNGFRFVNQADDGSTSKFTDVDPKFPFWGLGKHTCPGRIWASYALKLLLVHIISKYDFKFADEAEGVARTFNWRTATVPLKKTALLFHERNVSEKIMM